MQINQNWTILIHQIGELRFTKNALAFANTGMLNKPELDNLVTPKIF